MFPGVADRRRGRYGGDVSPFILMKLLYEAFVYIGRLGFVPYVTIFFLGLNIYYHVFPNSTCMGYYMAHIESNCLHPAKIAQYYFTGKNADDSILWGISNFFLGNHVSRGFPYNRLFLSALIHATDMHLYGNMMSLLWKGCNLERIYGGKKFLFLVVYSWFVSHILLVLLSYFLYKYIYVDDGYSSGYNTCAGKISSYFSLENPLSINNTFYHIKIILHLLIHTLLTIFLLSQSDFLQFYSV